MQPLKKEDISQEVFDLYDYYAHNKINRIQFVEKLSLYAIGGLTVSSLLSFLTPNYLDNLTVKPDDPNLDSKLTNLQKVVALLKGFYRYQTGLKENYLALL